MTQKEAIKIFEEKKVRAIWDSDKEEWYFSVVDVVAVLTDSANPTDYLKKMRKRDSELASFETVQKVKTSPVKIGYLISVSNRDTSKSRVLDFLGHSHSYGDRNWKTKKNPRCGYKSPVSDYPIHSIS